MKKLDGNAVFNIVIKAVIFCAVFSCVFCLLLFLVKLCFVFAALSAVVLALAAVFAFSFLLRYTRFYYGYYSFVSGFLYKDKTGEVYCPCCNKYFAGFHDERYYKDKDHYNPSMFSKSRQDVICDFCRSAPRHRIIAGWAENNISLLKGSKVLYFAPELSMMLWFKRKGISVRTADLYEKRADLKLDITAVDLPSESEDVVFCNHVLEHVSDYSVALSELHRIIRKGGTLIISFPIDPALDDVRENKDASKEERIKIFGQHDHLRIFGKNSKKMLEDAGFSVEIINTDDLSDDIIPVTGPADYDTNMIFCCTRK